jgi:NitT/TauT family transport system substrate-binding protein
MSAHHARRFSRRRFLGGVTLLGTVGWLGLHPRVATAEPPPETTQIRLIKLGGLCLAPQFVAEELLRAEGFTEVQYVETVSSGAWVTKALASGEAHISLNFAAPFIMRVDAGDPIVILAGVHAGCLELFGTDRVQTIRDLKGKIVAVHAMGSSQQVFLATMVAYVGLDPGTDLHWVTPPWAEAMQLFAEGKIDALMTSPPRSQELRAQQIGHVVVNTSVDRPWSQYFCCLAAGNQVFVRTHPVATKRALRAILKATDLCALEPDHAAQLIVEKGFTPRYDYALQGIQEIPYNRWREYDPEDSVRFNALRLHEIGLIKSTPQKIIAQGTDWRFFNALKKELKG